LSYGSASPSVVSGLPLSSGSYGWASQPTTDLADDSRHGSGRFTRRPSRLIRVHTCGAASGSLGCGSGVAVLIHNLAVPQRRPVPTLPSGLYLAPTCPAGNSALRKARSHALPASPGHVIRSCHTHALLVGRSRARRP